SQRASEADVVPPSGDLPAPRYGSGHGSSGESPEGVQRGGCLPGGRTLIDDQGHGLSDGLGLHVIDVHAGVLAIGHDPETEGWRSSWPPPRLGGLAKAARHALSYPLALELREGTEDGAVETSRGAAGIEGLLHGHERDAQVVELGDRVGQ